jgi:hypothetical protein
MGLCFPLSRFFDGIALTWRVFARTLIAVRFCRHFLAGAWRPCDNVDSQHVQAIIFLA